MFMFLFALQLDKRLPHVLRVGPCPLYNSFADVYQFIETLQQSFVKLGK